MTDSTAASDANTGKFRVVEALWPRDKAKLHAVRYQVFVVEQQVPEELEWVGDDDQYAALLALDIDQQPIGTGRISADGVIGRMAVLKDWRRCGVGSALLQQLIELGAAMGHRQLTLSAQLHALEFYIAHGFVARGTVYLDAGIEHRTMTRTVPDSLE